MTNIFARCRALGIRHQDIADRAGVDRGYVTCCAGGRKPTSQKVQAAAEALCREHLSQRVDELGDVMAATLAEQAAGGEHGS